MKIYLLVPLLPKASQGIASTPASCYPVLRKNSRLKPKERKGVKYYRCAASYSSTPGAEDPEKR